MSGCKHTPYYELLDALRGEECPLCFLGHRSASRYLDALVYEHVNDPGTRQKTAAAQGFCRLHAWQLRRHGGALGIAIVYRDVVRDLVRSLRAARFEPASRRSLRGAVEWVDTRRPSAGTARAVRSLSPDGECPACTAQRQSEAMYAQVLVENLADEDIVSALASGAGLCLPHLRLCLRYVRDETSFNVLVQAGERTFTSLLEDLDEMVRLSDYRYLDQRLGQVGDSWIRAIAQVSGREGLS